MRLRRLGARLLLAGIVFAVLAVLAVRFLAPPDLQWRAEVLQAKATGRLAEMPLPDLLRWLAPGSPVYLADLARTPNVHASIRNTMNSAADVQQGKLVYLRQCGQCHGDGGHGNSGPNLLNAVAGKSDWSFFATAKWGRAGTSMQAQGISDVQIWQVHAFLREQALAAAGAARAKLESGAARVPVDVPAQRILDADAAEWLTYAGNYAGHRHSLLAQLGKANVARLRLAWVAQLRQVDRELQVSPIVAGGLMYLTESRDGVVALDAASGATVWKYRREIPGTLAGCCGTPNRGVAILGQTVYVATADAYLVALDANTGRQRWIVKVAERADGYTMTGAPLALADRIVVGVAGGELGVRGFLAAYAPADGAPLWKFNTVPGPGEAGHETWGGDSWKTGGAPTWVTGAYDPKLDLIYWGAGNPSPEFKASARPGDNLYSNSVVALDAKTGKLRWHYQFTPADEHDWDSNQQPVLAEIDWQGQHRAVLLWANRNAFFYALDRTTGEFLYAKPFVKQTWNEGFDAKGRPRTAASAHPTAAGALVWPAIMAATNWWPPSLDPQRQLMFVPCSEAAGLYFQSDPVNYTRGERFEGSVASFYAQNLPTTAHLKAIDTRTGEVRWQHTLASGSDDFVWTVGGVLSTVNGVVFSGYRDVFRAFDADSGQELWRINLGGRVRGSPVSFALDGRQYVSVAAGHAVFTFVLDERVAASAAK